MAWYNFWCCKLSPAQQEIEKQCDTALSLLNVPFNDRRRCYRTYAAVAFGFFSTGIALTVYAAQSLYAYRNSNCQALWPYGGWPYSSSQCDDGGGDFFLANFTHAPCDCDYGYKVINNMTDFCYDLSQRSLCYMAPGVAIAFGGAVFSSIAAYFYPFYTREIRATNERSFSNSGISSENKEKVQEIARTLNIAFTEQTTIGQAIELFKNKKANLRSQPEPTQNTPLLTTVPSIQLT